MSVILPFYFHKLWKSDQLCLFFLMLYTCINQIKCNYMKKKKKTIKSIKMETFVKSFHGTIGGNICRMAERRKTSSLCNNGLSKRFFLF